MGGQRDKDEVYSEEIEGAAIDCKQFKIAAKNMLSNDLEKLHTCCHTKITASVMH